MFSIKNIRKIKKKYRIRKNIIVRIAKNIASSYRLEKKYEN
jgi:hypothetical protein